MTSKKNQLPEGEFRENADRGTNAGPNARPRDAKAQKDKPVADKVDRSDPNPNFSGSEYQGQSDVESRSDAASRPKRNT